MLDALSGWLVFTAIVYLVWFVFIRPRKLRRPHDGQDDVAFDIPEVRRSHGAKRWRRVEPRLG